MAELGLPWDTLTHVALSHFHADHTNDLPALIYAWRYGRLAPRTEPVQIVGPPGLARRVTGMLDAFGADLLAEPPSITIIELVPGESWTLSEELVLGSRKVPHTNESVAYSVSGHGRRVVVSGDTGFDAGLATWAEGCDVLLSECSLPDALALPTHLTPRQCGALAAIARPGLLALTHFYPPVEHEAIRDQVAESFGGPVSLSVDGWMTSIEAV
jgi:ribonuclease BN (tRNA processing enzyme)